jgi:hypothetical protein
MRVVCAWCQHEGRSHLLRITEPLDDTSETHGICDRHQQALLELFPSASFPSTKWLFVVSPVQPGAYEHLSQVMHGIPGVTVIVDRRRGERRRGGGGVTPAEERRRADRRVRRPEWSGLGYVLVRFAPRELTTPGNPSSGEPEPDGVPPRSNSIGVARVVLPNNF